MTVRMPGSYSFQRVSFAPSNIITKPMTDTMIKLKMALFESPVISADRRPFERYVRGRNCAMVCM